MATTPSAQSTRAMLSALNSQRLDHHQTVRPILHKIGGIGSLLVACLLNPCCAPLFVPLLLALLAGTPLAAFLAQYLGWVYAGLTVLSLLSLYMAWHWLSQKHTPAKNVCTSPTTCQLHCTCKEEV